MLQVKDLRDSYLAYFKERGHKIVPSSALVPKDDPTLLFTTAGMVQFKPMFAGTVKLDYTRAASVQKCLRTSDLENVGKTKRHCTFFEMLGNFSFGDYFKTEAIEFAWEFSTSVIKFPKEKIWVSIYENDDEAFEIWNKHIGVPAERIVRLGKADNFWGPAGDSGACGPCSELYLDRGEAFGCGKADCKPGCECERFLEFWNLVFNQFYQDTNGVQTPLPRTGIDTGMGLERLATLVQNVDSIYQTNELASLVQKVCEMAHVKYEGDNMSPVNIIVEHARSLTMAMSDGAYPSNEGRGYVLRRILRRALRFSRQLGVKEPFVYRMVDPIVEIYGAYYPELIPAAKNIKSVLEGEEKRFLETLEHGMTRLDDIIKSITSKNEKQMSGADAFVLYDTFGFPFEMTKEILEEQGLSVDAAGFETEMKKQRERGKSSWKNADSSQEKCFQELSVSGSTKFSGYTENTAVSKITALADGVHSVKLLGAGANGFLVSEQTPFYGESGGQCGDRGTITGPNGSVFTVHDVKKYNKTFIHIGTVERGVFSAGDAITLTVDAVSRNLTKANHTATHLLQSALRSVLGTHVKQAGSFVEADRLRFDFSHFEAMTPDEISQVEIMVNQKIWENLPVTTSVMDLQAAVATGAMAVFDEKYEDTVRVVEAAGFSKELCGGTHVDNTGKIGLLKIVREASPGAGLRRIEAVTLKGILEMFNERTAVIDALVSELGVTEKELARKAKEICENEKTLAKELQRVKNRELASNVDEIISKAADASGVKIISHIFDGADVEAMRAFSDVVRSKEQNCIVLLGSSIDGKAMLLAAASKTAVDRGADAGALIKKMSAVVGGGGGGRKDMAQAGGKDPAKLADAVADGIKVAQGMIK